METPTPAFRKTTTTVKYFLPFDARLKIIIIKRFIRCLTIYISISNRSVAEITACN